MSAKAGYLESVVTMVSHYQTSTLWNHAGPGIIGLGVDAAARRRGASRGHHPSC